MTVYTKAGGLATRHWFQHDTTKEVYDVLVGSDEETTLAADSDYSTITSFDSQESREVLVPTDMPDTVE